MSTTHSDQPDPLGALAEAINQLATQGDGGVRADAQTRYGRRFIVLYEPNKVYPAGTVYLTPEGGEFMWGPNFAHTAPVEDPHGAAHRVLGSYGRPGARA